MESQSILLQNVSLEQLRAMLSEIVQSVQHPSPLPPPDPLYKELMTLEEVASYFKKHQDTIITWTKKKILKKYGIGRAIFYKRREVENAVIPL
jgi:hypothetical protein